MKINLIPSKKTRTAFCGLLRRNACGQSQCECPYPYCRRQSILGQIIPGTDGNAERTAYVNHMIGMNLGGLVCS